MKIGICNDHAGVEYKTQLSEYLSEKGYEIVNFGTDTTDSMDYPDVAHPLAAAVENGEVDLGIAFCGTGNGMAMALNKPCVSLSTLESMAYNFIDAQDTVVCACMDARRNQVYNALFCVNDGSVERLCDDRAVSVEELLAELKELNKKIVLVGDGAQLCFEQNDNNNVHLACVDKRFQRASSVALCAVTKLNAEETVTPAALMPTYLRPSQAERERLKKEKE